MPTLPWSTVYCCTKYVPDPGIVPEVGLLLQEQAALEEMTKTDENSDNNDKDSAIMKIKHHWLQYKYT
jgi:hypothetical protein